MRGVLVWVPGESEPAVVAALGEARGVVVERRCADLAELLSAARAGVGSIAVLALTRGVDRNRIAELRQAGVSTVLLSPAADLHRAGALGADTVVPHGGEVAALVTTAVAELIEAEPPPAGLTTSDRGTPGAAPRPTEPDRTARPGTTLAIWGPAGSPGRSSLAAALATEIQLGGRRTTLVDTDTLAPSLAQQLGLLEEAAGLASLCRSAAAGTLDAAAVRQRSVLLPTGVTFVSGLTRADRWREITAEALTVALDAVRHQCEITVLDTAGGLEAAPARGHDRFAATRVALGAADLVLVVVAPDPVGVRRAVQALADLDAAQVSAHRRIVLNAPRPTRDSAITGAREALRRFAGAEVHHVVPYDGAVPAAVLAGCSLAEHASRSPARRALVDLAESITAPRRASRPPRSGRLRDWRGASLRSRHGS